MKNNILRVLVIVALVPVFALGATTFFTAADKINLDANSTHRTSSGSDHTYIDQVVTSGAAPTFDGANFTGVPDGALPDGLTRDTEWDTIDEIETATGADIAEADGDTYTGTHDFGGAALEIPNGANPTTGADGRVAHDTDDDAIEIDGKLITTKYQRDKDIWDPDTIQASKDAIPFFPVEAEAFPHGITVTDCGIKVDTATSYSVTFEEWTDPTTHSSDIETVATSSATEAEDDGTMADGSVAAGSIIFIDLPDTDVTWLNVWLVFTVNEGD